MRGSVCLLPPLSTSEWVVAGTLFVQMGATLDSHFISATPKKTRPTPALPASPHPHLWDKQFRTHANPVASPTLAPHPVPRARTLTRMRERQERGKWRRGSGEGGREEEWVRCSCIPVVREERRGRSLPLSSSLPPSFLISPPALSRRQRRHTGISSTRAADAGSWTALLRDAPVV